MEKELISFINDTFLLQVQNKSYAEIKMLLSYKINDWIKHDFEKLIFVLYRIDVSEKKIMHLLQENQSENAADILAELIIERQLQKIASRKENTPPKRPSDEET